MSTHEVQDTHEMTVGDTLSPLRAQLLYKDESNQLSYAESLAGYTVKFLMKTERGQVKVAESELHVTIVDAASRKVKYNWQAADVDTPGTYYAWFVVYSAGGAKDTYPKDGRAFRIVIAEAG